MKGKKEGNIDVCLVIFSTSIIEVLILTLLGTIQLMRICRRKFYFVEIKGNFNMFPWLYSIDEEV